MSCSENAEAPEITGAPFDSFALAVGAPKVVLANSLADAFVGRVGLAVLLGALGFGCAGVFVAQAASPAIPSIVGALYTRGWARRNCPGCLGRARDPLTE